MQRPAGRMGSVGDVSVAGGEQQSAAMPEQPERAVGEEARKAQAARIASGFVDRYLSGAAILDIGYKGYVDDVVPIVPQAVGVDLDYPGYDGRTLPFPDGSQDAVFSSHSLEHIADFRGSLGDWLRVLKPGGFLVLIVPHQHLYEKRLALPSRWNADHKRFYTPASLLLDIENALPPNSYRVRHLADNDAGFDYRLPPDVHSGGSYEIELVLEKIVPPGWQLAVAAAGTAPPPAARPLAAVAGAEPVVPVAELPGRGAIAPGLADAGGLLVRDFAPPPPRLKRICVLKLDHFGDLIMAMPALAALRRAFPDHHIRLLCGSWNVAAATATGLVDEVRGYDFFPEHAGGWDGRPAEDGDAFRAAAAGAFDIAIDLRVDDDTRHLLAAIDARLRCGIGSQARFPFLDVALPLGHYGRGNPIAADFPEVFLQPRRFTSSMQRRTLLAHDTPFSGGRRSVLVSPSLQLPVGHLRVVFGLSASGSLPAPDAKVKVQIARQGEVIASQIYRRLQIRALDAPVFEIDNTDPNAQYEFRVHMAGRALGRLRFTGVRIERLDGSEQPRLRPVEVHIGEQIGLLVELLRQRAVDLYAELRAPQAPASPSASAYARQIAQLPAGVRRIVLAPFSNSTIRDWPLDKYARLIHRLLDRLDACIIILGSRLQTAQASALVQKNGGDARILNLAGLTRWTEIPELLCLADLVICNNSGVAHQAAMQGVPTLAIYSGSHQPQEWGPRGPAARAIMAPVPCSPCGFDRLEDCPRQHLCMQLIDADAVFEQALELLARHRPMTEDRRAPAAGDA